MQEKRYIGLDLIRTICFLAIICFHGHFIFWSTLSTGTSDFDLLWQSIEVYARIFCFSGFVILSLSSFLYGLMERPFANKSFLFAFFFLAWAAFNVILYFVEGTDFHFAWDIYGLLLVGFPLSAWVFKQSRALVSMIGLSSLLMLALPVWNLTFLDSYLGAKEVVLGLCPNDYADWPLLPWLGMVFLSFSLGRAFRTHLRQGQTFLPFSPWEWFYALPILVFFLSYAGVYYRTPLQNEFACYVFRRPPAAFWAHWLFWLFLGRLCLTRGVQKRLSSLAFLQNWGINRSFFLAYFLHYVLLFAFEGVMREWGHVRWRDAAIVAVVVLTELGSRLRRK